MIASISPYALSKHKLNSVAPNSPSTPKPPEKTSFGVKADKVILADTKEMLETKNKSILDFFLGWFTYKASTEINASKQKAYDMAAQKTNSKINIIKAKIAAEKASKK